MKHHTEDLDESKDGEAFEDLEDRYCFEKNCCLIMNTITMKENILLIITPMVRILCDGVVIYLNMFRMTLYVYPFLLKMKMKKIYV